MLATNGSNLSIIVSFLLDLCTNPVVNKFVFLEETHAKMMKNGDTRVVMFDKQRNFNIMLLVVSLLERLLFVCVLTIRS